MSRTDKTNPPWVKITRREGAVKGWRIYHFTRRPHGCDPQPVRPRDRLLSQMQHCEIWNRYSENGKMYGRQPNRATRKAIGFEASIRAELVQLRRHWATTPDRESIDSSWGAPRRHCQVRDPWHWD